MPVQPTYPGVYIEEIPSAVRTITGVATSVTAFIGRAKRGPIDKEVNKENRALTINSYGDFERIYGGLMKESAMGYAVRDFFLNGGSQAIIVRLYHSTFASEADRTTAQSAGKAVAVAATGDTPQNAVDNANVEAGKHQAGPEKDAVTAVVRAAQSVQKLALTAFDSAKDDQAKKNAAIAQITRAATRAAIQATAPDKTTFTVAGLSLEAAYPGAWGQYLRAMVTPSTASPDFATALGVTQSDLFDLTIREETTGGASEQFRNLTAKDTSQRIDGILKASSRLVRWSSTQDVTAVAVQQALSGALQAYTEKQQALKAAIQTGDPTKIANALANLATARQGLEDPVTVAEENLAAAKQALTAAQKTGDNTAIQRAKDDVIAKQQALEDAQDFLLTSDGAGLDDNDFTGPNYDNLKQGLYALKLVDLFNILCIPPYQAAGDDYNTSTIVIGEAAVFCEEHRAILLVDPPSSWTDKNAAKSGVSSTDPDNIGTRSKNAALFFPRLQQPDPLSNNQVKTFAPCGAVAGIFARTDTQRGVWKAPAGIDAALVNVPQLSVNLNDAENGELNPLGINCLRAFPVTGRVIWGSRTLQGNDGLTSEWKYIPVRRTALYIEESLFRGLQWAVFEPNDEPLWAQIRLNVGSFMQSLFRQGAFQGQSPRDAYLVKCDKETTTQNDINQGIVNVIVGFAPLKPAEFVFVKIQQLAGQINV